LVGGGGVVAEKAYLFYRDSNIGISIKNMGSSMERSQQSKLQVLTFC
jgi:hypothetical protein